MKTIKVLVQGREDFLAKPGGDYFSILDKSNHLKNIGAFLDFNSDPTISLDKYDLVHIQQSILNTDNVKLQLNNAIKWNKPVIFKPFYNPEKDGSYYLNNGQSKIIKILYKIIDNYFKTYPKIRTFIENTLKEARKLGYVKTLLGRRRYADGLTSSNMNMVKAEERACINMPIQGTAAELIKIAMININKKIKKDNLKSKMILQIHDELLFEVPSNELNYLSSLVKKEMETAMELAVPLKVDCDYGKNWFEAH